MSVIEIWLKEAQKIKGTHHKLVISGLREYIAGTTEEEVISAINKLTDNSLIFFLWEVGLSQTLQDVANRRSQKIAGTTTGEVI